MNPAATPAFRSVFEFGRLQTESDALVPLACGLAVAAYVVWVYGRERLDVGTPLACLLGFLRLLAFAGLAIVYLQPQWRNETDLLTPSRVVLVVDTSLSMGLTDADDSQGTAAPTRAQQVAAALAESDWLATLRRTHEVAVYRFDQDTTHVATLERAAATDAAPAAPSGPQPTAAPPAAATAATGGPAEPAEVVDWAARLEPTGLETRLGEALREVLREERASPLAGVIVVTDGRSNSGLDPTAVVPLAREERVPLLPVGIGSVRPPVNVRVSDFVAPARAYPGDSYTATGFIQGQGMSGRTVVVELTSQAAASGAAAAAAPGPVVLEGTEQLTLGGDGEITPVKFQLTPDAPGRRTLTLSIRPPADDRHPHDNRQEVDVEIVDRASRVLLFAGGPTREYQYVRNLLKRDRDTVVDVFLQTGAEGVSQDAHAVLPEFPSTAEALFAYDAIVAFDPDWRALDAPRIELVERWVADQGGGLIVVAGPVYTDLWSQQTAGEADRVRALGRVRALYPVEFQRRFSVLDEGRYGSREPWPLEFTREGAEAEFLLLADSPVESAAAWEAFPGVYGYHAVKGAKPGATVYARYSDPRAAEGGQLPPLLAAHFYGSGRVVYLGTGEFYRLRSLDEGYFERFYTQLVRHASQGRLLRGSSRGVLLVDQDRFLLGQLVQVRARLTDPRLEPLVAPQAALRLVAPDGSAQTIMLAAEPDRPGNFQGQFPVRKEGVYRLELPVPDSAGEVLSRRIQVRVPDLERENPERNDPLLEELAQKTEGHYYPSLAAALSGQGDTPPLADRLADRTRTTTQIVKPHTLWDNWVTLLGICGVLCLEWLVRRLARLA